MNNGEEKKISQTVVAVTIIRLPYKCKYDISYYSAHSFHILFLSLAPRCHNRHREQTHKFFKQNKCSSCLPSENCQIEFGSIAMPLSVAAHVCVHSTRYANRTFQTSWFRSTLCRPTYIQVSSSTKRSETTFFIHFSFRFDIMQLNYPV